MGGDFAQSKESLGNNFLLAVQSATLLPMNQVISQRGCEGRLGSPGRPAPGPERKSSPGGQSLLSQQLEEQRWRRGT